MASLPSSSLRQPPLIQTSSCPATSPSISSPPIPSPLPLCSSSACFSSLQRDLQRRSLWKSSHAMVTRLLPAASSASDAGGGHGDAKLHQTSHFLSSCSICQLLLEMILCAVSAPAPCLSIPVFHPLQACNVCKVHVSVEPCGPILCNFRAAAETGHGMRGKEQTSTTHQPLMEACCTCSCLQDFDHPVVFISSNALILSKPVPGNSALRVRWA